MQLPSVPLKVNSKMLQKNNLFCENHKLETRHNIIGLMKLEYRYYAELLPSPTFPHLVFGITK